MDYSKTKIYRIPVGDMNYYGHTTKLLCQRRGKHVQDFNKYPNRKVYKAMIELGMTADDIKLVWVEDYPCKSVHEAKAREHYWIENFGTLNKNKPYKDTYTEREYQREYQREYHRERYEQHKDKKLAKQRERYEQHKDKKLAKNREYHEQYKDAINAKRRERYRLKKQQTTAS